MRNPSSTNSNYNVPLFNRVMRNVLRPIFRALFYLLSPIRIIGKENIPAAGPYIIAINHISLYEAPFIVAFWPVVPEAMGASVIWEKKGQNVLAMLYGGIKVHRGEYDRKVLDQVLAALHSGRPLLIAPEGGRSHIPGMRQAYPGVAYLMEKARVPVVPVGIIGTTTDYFSKARRGLRPELEMHIGKPFVLPEVHGRGEQRRVGLKKNADLVMAHIASLLPETYRGVYADYEEILRSNTIFHQEV